jgi:hypothetical protein
MGGTKCKPYTWYNLLEGNKSHPQNFARGAYVG